ncbi:hypothetical protein D0Z07_7222 [Hyphodiscus hymeniophilus]|uniref:Uncharacterized protein n=1 Tax=Hyphodiscus hymeniophilus TaxID=353542 RepID=A0A9P7AUZ7_9HELO|nr:hypothetical protein D0Z07_7222 [Hyphodiscus hymeniophilus]
MAAGPSTEELLKRLDDQHKAYLDTFKLVHEALSQNVVANTIPTSPEPSKRRRRSTVEHDVQRPERRKLLKPGSVPGTSVWTGDSDESDDDDELYVQTYLPSYKFDHENLRQHLKHHPFNVSGKKILETVIDNGRLLDPTLFPEYPPNDRSHNSHYSVFDVGADGAPLSRHEVVKPGTTSIDSAIWQAIQDLNTGSADQRKAVGRISIIREPSPIILGALHLTMNSHFDMDEIFIHLISSEASSAHISDRAFSADARRQRSFIFNFDYYTVIGDGCAPMPWQLTDIIPKKSSEHIPISRCSSIVALSLTGGYIKKLKNSARRAKTQYGYVYDPWASWHVLNIQCYPDHKHSMDSHDSTKHYVNGPEAFLTTLLAEFKDAQKRFEEIYNKISKLVTPPADFMFNGKLRDRLLFEDEEFTYSRRYFWAYQTLGMLKNGIKAIIDAYEDTFTDEVWEGKHKSLWPILEDDSPRNVYWKKRMAGLKKDFEKEMKGLDKLYEENDDLRKEIRTLRDQLFSGTSVLESRKSVELSAVTILQGHNIKLLTLVSIFFLPLTFVTSVFGMTNMPVEHNFKDFGVTMATVCVPFFVLIGFLNTTAGMEFWRDKWHRLLAWLTRKPHNGQALTDTRTMSMSKTFTSEGQFLFLVPIEEDLDHKRSANERTEMARQGRSYSATQTQAIRKAKIKSVRSNSASTVQNENGGKAAGPPGTQRRASLINTVAVSDSDRKIAVVGSTEKADNPPSEDGDLSWWEKVLGRKKRGAEHHV